MRKDEDDDDDDKNIKKMIMMIYDRDHRGLWILTTL